MTSIAKHRIAVIVPCYNEELTIGKVVTDFRAALPDAAVYVVDNNSNDRTAEVAFGAGATVLKEKRQGKGEVLRGVCGQIEADYFILVDGDNTYPAQEAARLLDPLVRDEADVVIGSRRNAYGDSAPALFHRTGNEFVCFLVNRIFGSKLTDVMSGYRAFTWRVAQSLPIISIGFDVETEMTIQLLYRRYVLKEIPIGYRSRPADSVVETADVQRRISSTAEDLRIARRLQTAYVLRIALAVFRARRCSPDRIRILQIGIGNRFRAAGDRAWSCGPSGRGSVRVTRPDDLERELARVGTGKPLDQARCAAGAPARWRPRLIER